MYRYAGSGGGNDKSEEKWDAKGELGGLLESLDAVNRGGDGGRLWASVDVNAVVREMAAQTVMLHQDRCAKNYYVYKSKRSSGKWTRIPWDMEDAFATDYRDFEGRCDAGGASLAVPYVHSTHEYEYLPLYNNLHSIDLKKSDLHACDVF